MTIKSIAFLTLVTPQFSRSSTDSLRPDGFSLADNTLPTIAESQDSFSDDNTHWHAFSLGFVALPALAGLLFENGHVLMTDVLLLLLGCLFLYWSVKWPWLWYHTARGRIFVDYDPDFVDEYEHALGTELESDGEADGLGQPLKDRPTSKKEEKATAKLQRVELLALAACFGLPLVVAYLMHAIRPYLSRPSGGIVSNSNLTLFVLAAEVRPIFHVFKLIEARTLHLQKIVATEANDIHLPTGDLKDVLTRLDDIEARLASLPSLPSPKPKDGQKENDDMSNFSRNAIQSQLDALTRAVRRYEKRTNQQSAILDAKFRDLDNRVNDSLSLAAAASRLAHKPGIITYLFDLFTSAVFSALAISYMCMTWPFRMLERVNVFLFGTPKRGRKEKKK